MSEKIFVLTGGIGSGKSAVSDLFAKQGVTVVDADVLSRSLTAPDGAAIDDICRRFGKHILDSSGGIDRAAMRTLVFGNPDAREALEQILHPMIQARARELLEKAVGPYALYVVPLWAEQARKVAAGGARPAITPHGVIVVDSPERIQIQRVMDRDGLEENEVRAIMRAQAGREERLKLADHVIVNDGGLEALRNQVNSLHERLIQP